ncbi:MAG: carbonic anhydrase [Terracidiphilus sp.]
MKNRYTVSRRAFIMQAAAASGLTIASSGEILAEAQKKPSGSPINPDQALRELLEGNKRFQNGQTTGPRRNPADFRSLAAAQYPEAIIVSCADSRVAPEILFDVGIGDIFVIRVAGNVVTGAGVTVKGSIEYGVAELNAPLIMVLGHSGCGAVKAAKQHIDAKDPLPGAIDGLVELVKPAVAQSKGEPGDPLENAIRKNVELGVERLKNLEPILAPKVREGKLKVVGAVYDLRNGEVKLLQQ